MKLTRKSKKSLLLLAGMAFVIFAFTITVNAIKYTNSPASDIRLVTFIEHGKKQVILTQTTTVHDALQDARITLAPEDVTEPGQTSKLATTDSTVTIYRARPVIIADGAIREKVMTIALTPAKMLADADLPTLGDKDTTTLTETNSIVASGATLMLTVKRAAPPTPKQQPLFVPGPNALTRAKSAQMFTDSKGVVHRETYYDLPMNVVIRACGGGDYTIRSDGAKIDKDGYVLVAANYKIYPKCSVVETSMGPGKVYDTGGFVLRHPVGFDLATDWTNYDGR